jgi:predicted metal-dependent phosphoesterase TrpH
MAVDLHVHALLSKKFEFEPPTVDLLQQQAVRVGLAGFALTEHIHARDFWLVHDHLRRRYAYRDGVYRGGLVPMLSGAEVTVREAGDTIVVGDLEAMRAFDGLFARRLSDAYHPTLAEFLEAVRRVPLIAIAAHPYRPEKKLARCRASDLARFDAVEVNGKDAFLRSSTVMRTRRLATRLGLPNVGSSDCHFWPQLGVVATTLPAGDLTLDHLRASLRAQATRVRLRAHGRGIVRFCRTHKSLVKARLAAAAPQAGEAVA